MKNTKKVTLLICGVFIFAASLNVQAAGPAQTRTTKKTYSSVDSSSISSLPSGRSQELGLGIILGEPTGFSGKYWVDSKHAIDAGLAYSFSDFFLIYGDYLWHFGSHFLDQNSFTQNLNFYAGVGGGFRISTQDDGERKRNDNSMFEFFLRFPGGLEWRPWDPPLGVFFELAPGMKAIPSVGVIFHAGIGVRYYF